MAYNVKYRLSFSSFTGVQTQIDILKEGYSGDVVVFEGGTDPLRPLLEGEETTHDAIKPTAYEISFFVDTHGDYAEFLEIDDRDYKVIIYEDAQQTWTGWLLAETVSEEIQVGKYQFHITAGDGLRMLKNIEYSPNGRKSHIDIVAECLLQTGHQLDIRVGIPVFHKNKSGCPLVYTHVNTDIFRKNNAENWKCYDVLKEILELWAAKIVQEGNRWNIIAIDEQWDGQLTCDTFTYEAGSNWQGNFYTAKTIGNTIDSNTVELLAGSKLEKQAAYREAWIKQEYGKTLSGAIPNSGFNIWNSGADKDGGTLQNWEYNGVTTARYDYGDGDYYAVILGAETSASYSKYIYQQINIDGEGSNYLLKYNYALIGDNGMGDFYMQISITNSTATYYLSIGELGYGIYTTTPSYIKHSRVEAQTPNELSWQTNEIFIPANLGAIPGGVLTIKIFQFNKYSILYRDIIGIAIDNITYHSGDLPESDSTVYLYGQNNPFYNHVPERIETVMGDVPFMPNANLFYINYLSTDAAGDDPTTAWYLKSDPTTSRLINEIRLRSLLNANSKNLTVKNLRVQGDIKPLTLLVDHLGVKYQIAGFAGSKKDGIYDVTAIELVQPESNVPAVSETPYPNDPDDTNYYSPDNYTNEGSGGEADGNDMVALYDEEGTFSRPGYLHRDYFDGQNHGGKALYWPTNLKLDTTNFDGVLDSYDDTAQKAFETLDDAIVEMAQEIEETITEEVVNTSITTYISNFKESHLIDNTTSTSVVQLSTWTVNGLNERVGQFKATVMVRDKVTDTVYSLQNVMGFDHYDESNKVRKDNEVITDGTITMVCSVDAAKKFEVTLSGMPANAKRIHFCFERCISESVGLNAVGQFNLTANATNGAFGVLSAAGGMSLNASAGLLSVGDIAAGGNMALSSAANLTADGKLTASGAMGLTASAAFSAEFENIEFGYLYNADALSDSRNLANTGFTVPYGSDLVMLINYAQSPEYQTLKKAGSDFWNTDNGTDLYGFAAKGGGTRINDGSFSSLKEYGAYGSKSGRTQNMLIRATSEGVNSTSLYAFSVRLVNYSTTLSNGETGTYTGNDGKKYPTVCINGNEWLADNLKETKYRNGDSIPEVTGNSAWAGLSSGARCSYNNDENNA